MIIAKLLQVIALFAESLISPNFSVRVLRNFALCFNRPQLFCEQGYLGYQALPGPVIHIMEQEKY